MSAIYILSTPERSQQNMYKLGKHTGTESQLESRYITALLNVKIYMFLETHNATIIEDKLKKKLVNKRVKNSRGSLSEWVIMDLNKLEQLVKEVNFISSTGSEWKKLI